MEDFKSRKFFENQLDRWGLLYKALSEECKEKVISSLSLIDDATRHEAIAKWYGDRKVSEVEKKNIALKNGFFNVDHFEEMLIKKISWSKWCFSKFKPEIPEYFQSRRSQLDQVTYFLLRVRNQDLANELFFRLNEGEATFSEIANNFSEGPERRNGGLVGPVSMTTPHPSLVKIFQSSQSGQLWEPQKIEDWWVVVKLIKLNHVVLNSQLELKLSEELGEKYIESLIKYDLSNTKPV